MKSSAQLGIALQQAAHAIVPAVALILTIAELVLWINDRLAAWWVGVLGLTTVTDIPVTDPAPTVTPESKPEPEAPAPKKQCRKAPKATAPAQTPATKPRPARRARRRKAAPSAGSIAETARA